MKNKYTENDYINRCSELGMKYIGIHKEKKKGTMIEFICPNHENKGVQSCDWSHFRVSSKGCPYCAGRYKTTEEVQKEVFNKSVILISEYLGNEKPITCFCKDCENIWVTQPKVLVTNKSGCPKCGKEKAIKGETKTLEQFKKELKEINPSLKVIGKYVNTHTKIKCLCTNCNHDFESYPSNLLNRTSGCPRCNMSNSERMMLQTLDDLNIHYFPQYSINDCKFVKALKFDAFDVENNIAFEYNGEQHYYPIDFGGKGEEYAQELFKLTCDRDKAKQNYCESHHIPLIIIPYWEKENMKLYIKSEIERMGLYNCQ